MGKFKVTRINGVTEEIDPDDVLTVLKNKDGITELDMDPAAYSPTARDWLFKVQESPEEVAALAGKRLDGIFLED